MKVRSGVQMPVKSGLPSAVLGPGPAGLAFSFSHASRAVPPPAGSVAAFCAKAANVRQQRARAVWASIIQNSIRDLPYLRDAPSTSSLTGPLYEGLSLTDKET